MPKIIDIPYGTYLAYVAECNITDQYLDLELEIAYGEWRGYFGKKDNVLSPKVPSGAYRIRVEYAAKAAEVIKQASGENKTVVAVVVGAQRYGMENKYHNITDVVDWRTCDTLSAEAKAWAEQHYDDDVYDNTPTVYDMLPYALQYAQAGLKIFPLSPCSKTPLAETKGFLDATNDIEKIKKWWSDNPFCNIGLATGNGISVIDVDVGKDNNGKTKDGDKSIEEWQEQNGRLPDTLFAISGKGGRHLYYKTENICSSATGIIKDVDVRSDGGYIVLPPSVHENGNRYRWVGEFEISKIAPADEVVNKLLSLVGSNYKYNDIATNIGVTRKISTVDILERLDFAEGRRNDSLYRYGCSLQSKGVEDKEIIAALLKINTEKCSPPLSETEVNRIYNSVIQKPKGDNKSSGKMIPVINKNIAANNKDFFLAKNISELDDITFEEYKKDLNLIYPYVEAFEELKTGVISYSIKSQQLAAFIRKNDRYFFIESSGEKPVPYWYDNGYYKQCNDLFFLGQIKKYVEIIDENLVEPAGLSKVYKILQTDLDNTIEPSALNADSNIINFANGFLHLDTLALHPHTPRYIHHYPNTMPLESASLIQFCI